MKYTFSVILATAVLVGAMFTIPTHSVKPSQPAEVPSNFNELKPDEEMEAQFNSARTVWETKMLADPATGKIPNGIAMREMAFLKEMNKMQMGMRIQSNPLTWTQRGPWNVGGRTRALAVDVSNENNILAGGVSGGMWRSTNGGSTWTKVTALGDHPGVDAITQDTRPGHNNVWYYLSGEAYGTSASGGSAFYLGDGAFKSIDSGATWIPLGATDNGTQNSFTTAWQVNWNLVTDPSDMVNDALYMCGYGVLAKSLDGGTTWSAIKGSFTSSGSYFTDVAVASNGVLFATFSSDGGSTKGIWRSDDGGATFTNITPANFAVNYDLIKIGIDPNDENRVYFLASGTDTMGLLTVNNWGDKEWNMLWKYNYISGNGTGSGGMWTDLTMSLPHSSPTLFDNFHAQGGYNLVVKVLPGDSNIVFIGATNIYRSTDAFKSDTNTIQIGGYKPGTQLGNFQVYPNHHPDQHEFLFMPSNPNIMLCGNDGGVYKTMNDTAASLVWQPLNHGYMTTQFYTCAIHPDVSKDIIMGGLQDNGNYWTNTTNPQSPWVMPLNGDGSHMQITSDGSVYYLSVQQGKIIKCQVDPLTGARTQWGRIDPIYASRGDYQFINPFVIDPNDEKIMYVPAGRKLFRNNNLTAIPYAQNFDSIALNWQQFNDTTTVPISAIAISKTNPTNRLYYGTEAQSTPTVIRSRLYRIDNANTGTPSSIDITATNAGLQGAAFPSNGYISCIAIDPRNADKVLVVFSNYNVYSLFYSENAGTTWKKVGGNIELTTIGSGDAPSCRWATIMPYNEGTKYLLGTSVGLFSADSLVLHSTSSPGTHWTQEGASDFGNMVVPMIQYRDADGLIAIATHGNGMWTSTSLKTGLASKTILKTTAPFAFPNPTKNNTTVSFTAKNSGPAMVEVYNLSGEKIWQQVFAAHDGENTFPLNTNSWSVGVYLCTITHHNEKQVIKLAVQ